MNVYAKGNYIVFLNEAENYIIQKPKHRTHFIKNEVASERYSFYFDNEEIISLDFSEIEDENNNPYASKAVFEDFLRLNTGFNPVAGGSATEFIYILGLSDFPTVQAGVITLLDNVTYYIAANIDLLGARLVGGANTVILGFSSENCSLTSTGLGVGVAVKVAGVTASGSYTSKFNNATNNRAVYTGAFAKTFNMTATLSLSSGNNDVIGVYFAKNGVLIPESEVYQQTDTNGTLLSTTIHALTLLEPNDYVEVFVENDSAIANVLVTDLNVIVS